MRRHTGSEIWVRGAVLAVLTVSAACASYRHVLFRRAAFDLNCPEESLVMHDLGGGTRGIAGCGKRATYVQRCDPPHGYVGGAYVGTSCGWVMDSRSEDGEAGPMKVETTGATAPSPAAAPTVPMGAPAQTEPPADTSTGTQAAPTSGGESPTTP